MARMQDSDSQRDSRAPSWVQVVAVLLIAVLVVAGGLWWVVNELADEAAEFAAEMLAGP